MTDPGSPPSSSARAWLTRVLPEPAAEELGKRLYFLASELERFSFVREGDGVVGVDLTFAAPMPPTFVAHLEQAINRVALDVLEQRMWPPKVLWQSARSGPFPEVFAQLEARGTVFVAGEGQIALGEPLISLMDYFDRRLRAIALALPRAQEFRYPTLLPTHVLERFRYFSSFPQFVMFVTRLHNDIEVYQRFAADYAASPEIGPSIFGFCRNHDYCLPPTMCYHTYHQFQGRPLDHDRVVTSKGKSFRFESKYQGGLKRLWDFTIREIVFMGSAEFVQGCRQAVMTATFELMAEFELAGSCAVASDLFFGGADTAGKIFSQKLMELKYELLLEVDGGETIAAASFNLHNRFFGEAFEIQRGEGDAIASGCVGFGLERLVYAFLCQHGLDPALWPAAVRQGIA